jgi:hypothetical protein
MSALNTLDVHVPHTELSDYDFFMLLAADLHADEDVLDGLVVWDVVHLIVGDVIACRTLQATLLLRKLCNACETNAVTASQSLWTLF